MLRNANASHIPGRDIITLEGTDKIEIAHHVSQNFQESFTFSILFQLTTPYQLSFALITKGLPESVTAGKIFMESVNGYLKVWLHNNNNTNSLVVLSNDPIINTNEIIHIAVTWDYTNKVLKIYKNAVDVPYTIQTGTGFHTSVSAMGLIRNNSDPMWIGFATGKNAAKIKLFGHMFLAERAWSSSEIDALYNTIKYTGTYPNQPKVIFSSNRIGSHHSLYIMNEDGTNQELFYNYGQHLLQPKWSLTGDYVTLTRENSTTSRANPISRVTSTEVGYIDKNANPSSLTWLSNSDEYLIIQQTTFIDSTTPFIYYSTDTGSTSGLYRKPPTSSAVIYTSDGNYFTIVPSYAQDFVYCLYESSSISVLNRIPHGGGSSLTISSTTGSDLYRQLVINRTNTKLAVAMRTSTSIPYNVWIIDLAGPSYAFTQVTTESSNCFPCGFTWDGTKLMYMRQAPTPAGTRWQIFRCDLDGSNHVNISNSIYNDFYGDSFLFS